MAQKWNRKICVEHITELKSPFQNKEDRMSQGIREAAERLKAPNVR